MNLGPGWPHNLTKSTGYDFHLRVAQLPTGHLNLTRIQARAFRRGVTNRDIL